MEKKINSLSERIKHLVRYADNNNDFIDKKIKSENLQYNLSLILSHIILKIKFIERSKLEFENIIK